MVKIYLFSFYLFLSICIFPYVLLASKRSTDLLGKKVNEQSWRSSPPSDLQPDGVVFPFREVWLTEPSPAVYIFVDSDLSDSMKLAKERRRTLLKQNWNCRLFLRKSLSEEDMELMRSRLVQASVSSKGHLKRGSPLIVLDPVNQRPKLAVLYSPTAQGSKSDEIIFESKMVKMADKLYRAGIDVFLTSQEYISEDIKNLLKMKIYLGDGDFASLIAGKYYYAYLFGDLTVENDSILRRGIEPSDLRKLEQARLDFIHMRSKITDKKLVEQEFKELVARLRILKRRSLQGESCSTCKEISGKECTECLRFITEDYFTDLEELARDSFSAEIWLEDRISRNIKESGQSVASYAMSVSTKDSKIPSYAYTLNVVSSARVPENKYSIFFKGQRCDNLSSSELALSSKLSNGLQVNFPNIKLQKNFDDICGAVSNMKSFAEKRKENGKSKINVQDCAGALILEFGKQFDWEKDGVITPVVESFLLSLCSSILGNKQIGNPDELLYGIKYSPSGIVMSPTSGEVDVNVAMERIEAEERVISAASFGKPCRISDLTYAGWAYDDESKLWIRRFDDSDSIPVAVRYVPIENGNVIPIGLDSDEKNRYWKNKSIFLDPPSIGRYWSKNMFVASGDVNDLTKLSAQYKDSKLKDLREALVMQQQATDEARKALESAFLARENYEKALTEEERLLELTKIASEQKEYCKTRASVAQKEAEIAELQKLLFDNLKAKIDVEAESANKLHEASIAEAKRREAAEKSKSIAIELLDSSKFLAKLNKKLKEKLSVMNKHRSAYDAIVLAENRILKDIRVANDLLDSSIDSELSARKRYDEDWSHLEKMEIEIKKRIQDIADARDKIKGSFSIKSKELKAIFESHQAQKMELELLVEKHMAKRDSLEKEITALLAMIEQHRKKNDEFKGEFDTLNSEITLLSATLKSTVNNISQGEADLGCMKKNMQDLEKELALITNAQNELMKLLNKNKSIRKEISEKLLVKEKERDGLVINIQSIEAELNQLKIKLASFEERITAMKLKLEAIFAQITIITDTLTKLEAQKTELDENSPDLLDLEAEESKLLAKLEQLKKKRATSEENLNLLLEKHTSLKNKISGKLEAKQLALQIAQKAVNELRLANLQVDKEFNLAKREYSDHLRHTGTLLSKHNQQKKELCLLIDVENNIAEELRSKVNEAKKHDAIIQEIQARVAALSDLMI